VAAACCCWAACPALASAGPVLDVSYTGVVTNITDTYGVFGPVALGNAVGGVIRYPVPSRPPDFDDGSTAQYNLAVTPGGSTRMTADLGSLHFAATRELMGQVYNVEDGDSIHGYDFLFEDGDASVLRTAGLPSGLRLSAVTADVGLFVTDPALVDYPNLPSTLLPLADFDSFFTDSILSVDVRDSNGHLVQRAVIEFQLTSVSAVPEPASVLLAGLAIPLLAARARRRRTG
jgi:hypothetical protein